MDTDWKFIPKRAGVPTRDRPEWSKPLISFRTASTLSWSYCWVSQFTCDQSSPAASTVLKAAGL